MHVPHSARLRLRRLILGAAALATSGLIAACGGASTSSTTASSPSRTASAQRSAFIKCLEQHGVTPPPRAANRGRPRANPGPPPAGRGGFAANPTHQAAFRACATTGLPFRAG